MKTKRKSRRKKANPLNQKIQIMVTEQTMADIDLAYGAVSGAASVIGFAVTRPQFLRFILEEGIENIRRKANIRMGSGVSR